MAAYSLCNYIIENDIKEFEQNKQAKYVAEFLQHTNGIQMTAFDYFVKLCLVNIYFWQNWQHEK